MRWGDLWNWVLFWVSQRSRTWVNGACPMAGIEPHYVSVLFTTFKSFCLAQILRMASWFQLLSQATFSILRLFSYIKLNLSQARLPVISRTHCSLLPRGFSDPHLFTWNELLPSPSHRILVFLENQVKWCLFCVGNLMLPCPKLLLHSAPPVSKPSTNFLRIGIVPYIWNWNKTDPYSNSGFST